MAKFNREMILSGVKKAAPIVAAAVAGTVAFIGSIGDHNKEVEFNEMKKTLAELKDKMGES